MMVLKDFNTLFTPYLIDFFQEKKNSARTYSPIIKEAIEKIASLTLSGGKRIRPALIYFAFRGFGGKSFRKVKNYCLSIELIQSWALIHDDIMDKTQTRRGQETIHTYFDKKNNDKRGESLAILCGDLAFSWAVELFNHKTLSDKKKEKQLRGIFSALTEEVIYGQMLDITKAKTESVILQMIRLKTAGYTFEKPLLMGAALAEASTHQLSLLSDIGIKLGIAFQIQDDILGVFGSPSRLGKSTFNDMREGKMNLLAIKTLNKLHKLEKEKFLTLWGNNNSGEEELRMIQHFMKTSGAYNECVTLGHKFIQEAQSMFIKDAIPIKLQKTLSRLISAIFMIQ